MRKLRLLLLLFGLIFIFSCDSNYIKEVKRVKFETMVVNNFRCHSVEDIAGALIKYVYPEVSLGDINDFMKWEEDSENGSKIIKISYKKAIVKVPTHKQGDSIQVSPEEITLLANNRSLPLSQFVSPYHWK